MRKVFSIKRCILLSAWSFFYSIPVWSQADSIPAYQIKADTAAWQYLPASCWQVLEDKSGSLAIDQVSTLPVSAGFHNSGSIIDSGARAHTFWFRYHLKNVMTREARIALNSMCDEDEFYVDITGQQRHHFLTGKAVDWNRKDGLKAADCIPFVLNAGVEAIVYQRSYNKSAGLPQRFNIAVVSTEKIIQTYYIDALEESRKRRSYFSFMNLEEAFIIGLIFFASIFNLLYFHIVRQNVYLYFTLFLLFLAINRLYNISSAYFSHENSSWYNYVPYLGMAWIFIQFFLISFIRSFFRVRRDYKAWDRILAGISFIVPLIMVVPPGATGNSWINVIGELGRYAFLLIFVPLLVTLLLYVPKAKHDRFTRLMIIGALPLISLYSVSFLLTVCNHLFPHHQFFTDALAWMQNRFRSVETICVSWFVVFSSRILALRYSHLQKENIQQALDKERLSREKELERNQLIQQQKIMLEKEVEDRTYELKHSLESLKSTQAQLIQSEKMASLGELTAGIAHEIQNPLNFVNNFSEVNTELIEELRQEINKGNTSEAILLANDIADNEQKINHHGRRADGIVKGMLQHSRTSTGAKEPTNINALAEEYLRLAYHGLRARDKSFNALLKTGYDPGMVPVTIVPQDIGRVILNLVTNAFYAVNEKKRLLASMDKADIVYEPVVSVDTKRENGKIEISVKDNGNGIPPKALDKIFQPFFTTKPAGQGTGLGLSLSYDIVKAHGGDLRVETKEGEGTRFIIVLPAI